MSELIFHVTFSVQYMYSAFRDTSACSGVHSANVMLSKGSQTTSGGASSDWVRTYPVLLNCFVPLSSILMPFSVQGLNVKPLQTLLFYFFYSFLGACEYLSLPRVNVCSVSKATLWLSRQVHIVVMGSRQEALGAWSFSVFSPRDKSGCRESEGPPRGRNSVSTPQRL